MSSDFTEQQSSGDLARSKDLSLQRTRPPSEVPGFQAQRFLGQGAYGEVWAGVDRNTGRKVAIKFYAHRRGVDWSLLEREVEKLVFLSADRYVVQLLKVGWDADPPYYVMELIENGSLDDLLRAKGTFGLAEATEMFREIAVGLVHAHGKGVLHCDLKPANILLDQDHKPRLADFGQSRLSHEQKPALGTLFYMAPEQADLEAVPDARWDVYALGAIFHCLVLGYPPHRNEAIIDQIDTAKDLPDRLARYRQAIRSAPPLTDHRRLMDRALADILERCLAADPRRRFANVQEALDALAARDRNRARLPMMVLGFLGPLIVLLITALFSYRGYTRAVEQAERDYTQLALQNNHYAAELAAEKVTAQIGRYFEIARDEGELGGFRPLFYSTLAAPSLERLSADADGGQAARLAFQNDPQRLALDHYLKSRLNAYHEVAILDSRAPRFASVFVTDKRGTQLASAFGDESQSLSIGKNFAHRPYFHGGPAELTPADNPPENPPHIGETHLSAPFRSTTQRTWKVAISTPIFREGTTGFEGVLVFTVNLGDFDMSQAATVDRDRFSVLVDRRDGADQGTILQHPLFEELAEAGNSVPDFLLGQRYRVPQTVLDGQGDAEYRDPLANIQSPRQPGETDAQYGERLALQALAEPFDRRWLASAVPVRPPIGASPETQAHLAVLVQSDQAAVVEPARQLGRQFIRNSLWMLVVMVSVSLALWYIVVRAFREPRAGGERSPTDPPSATPPHSASTIAVRR
ncbi:MAG: protein kinase [Pirellulaceae bacterium]|nr:protein kinase [Pirellulaceae bacterium]